MILSNLSSTEGYIVVIQWTFFSSQNYVYASHDPYYNYSFYSVFLIQIYYFKIRI